MRPPEAVLVARENEPRKPESSVTGSFCAGSDGDADMGLDSREERLGKCVSVVQTLRRHPVDGFGRLFGCSAAQYAPSPCDQG